MIGEKIDGVVWVRLTLPPDNPTQALTRLEGAPASLSILRLPGEVTIQEVTEHYTTRHNVLLHRVTRDEEIAREALPVQ